MTDVLIAAQDALRSAGWEYHPAAVPASLPERLDTLPADVVSWVSSFTLLASPDETSWFLCVADFADASDSAYAWNEFELLSRDSALTSDELEAISSFWASHRPILMSVRDGEYAYLAVRTDGVVVYGAEPEFEKALPVADSFTRLLEMIARGVISDDNVHSLLFDHRD
ncbi:hypothetical protein [Microbacterium sp.]|uniref:hypothetical protein n=1 Tax=Microbacterium sp. TaxID=51671 RepID=UPI003341C4C0